MPTTVLLFLINLTRFSNGQTATPLLYAAQPSRDKPCAAPSSVAWYSSAHFAAVQTQLCSSSSQPRYYYIASQVISPLCSARSPPRSALQLLPAHIVHVALVQAIFKDTRESLLRVGTMRFSDYIVTQRPMPPSRPLLVSNDRHSISFRFGIDVQSQPSDDVHATSIVSSSALLIDSRASNGDLSVFQSTPSGAPATQLQLILQVIALPQ